MKEEQLPSLNLDERVSTFLAPSAPELDDIGEACISLKDYETSLLRSFQRQYDYMSLRPNKLFARNVSCLGEASCTRVCAIRKQLWVMTATGEIKRVNIDSGSIRRVDDLHIKDTLPSMLTYLSRSEHVTYIATGATQLRNGDVIVSCCGARGMLSNMLYGRNGLLHVDPRTGKVIFCLSREHYADVTNNFDFVYALRSDASQSVVEILHYNSASEHCTTLMHINTHARTTRLLVTPHCMYTTVTTSAADEQQRTAICRQQLSLGASDLSPAELLKTIGGFETLRAGCCDADGNVLLVDRAKATLLLMRAGCGGRLQDLNVSGSLRAPLHDAIMLNDKRVVLLGYIRETNTDAVFFCDEL